MSFDATVLTMFPEAFPGSLGVSLIGAAWREAGLWTLETVDIRAFSKDKRGFLDDTPAGGGPGQVMRADVIASALDSVERRERPLLYMSARGEPLTQARVSKWAQGPGLIVLCGRFEGVDQRVIEARGFEEIAVGDVVLAGGEAAALVAIEACVRLVPGVLGQAASLSKKASRTGSSNIRSIRDRGRSKGWTSPKSCWAATTPKFESGGRLNGSERRGSGGRTCGRSEPPINRQRASKPNKDEDHEFDRDPREGRS